MPTVITVEGVPFRLEYSSSGTLVRAVSQQVTTTDSPIVVTFTPPLGPIENIDFGKVYQTIRAELP